MTGRYWIFATEVFADCKHRIGNKMWKNSMKSSERKQRTQLWPGFHSEHISSSTYTKTQPRSLNTELGFHLKVLVNHKKDSKEHVDIVKMPEI